MPIPMWVATQLARQGLKYGIKETLPTLKRELRIKPLNEGEELVIQELRNPQSPMLKEISEWDNSDLARAFDSPSYDNNPYLQNKVKEYIKTKW
ncbi:MAG: hypothetical protein J6N49_06650 [Alphaproteobacteria bacterium]|nr:hypothetical protein [Alphaproteobacteria bacterium]